MTDNKKKLYDALSTDYDMGTFEQFSQDIQNSSKRKKLYDAISNEYDLGDYDSFSSQLMGGDTKDGKKTPSTPLSTQQVDTIKRTADALDKGTTPVFTEQQLNEGLASFESLPDLNAPLTGFWEGAAQGGESLVQGGKYYIGDTGNMMTANAQNYKDALDYLIAKGDNWDASNFDADAEVEENQKKRFNERVAQYRETMKQRKKERENMGFWDKLGHIMDDPDAPDMHDTNMGEAMVDRVKADKPVYLLKEALEESGGDVKKARAILKEKSKMGDTWAQRWMSEASDKFAQMRPVEGAAWWGQMLPQMTGQATALGLSAIPATRGLGAFLGAASTTGLMMSSAGASMNEARAAGATDAEVRDVGMLAMAIEGGSEALPFGRLMNRVGKTAIREGFQKAASEASEAELNKLLKEAKAKIGGKFLSYNTGKELFKDVVAEGASEVAAGMGEQLLPLVYGGEMPTLQEYFENAFEQGAAGLVMGGFLGGGSHAITHYGHQKRRESQGGVAIGEYTNDNGGKEWVEVTYSKGGKSTIMHKDGTTEEVSTDKLDKGHFFTMDEWKKGIVDANRVRLESAYASGKSATDPAELQSIGDTYSAEYNYFVHKYGSKTDEVINNAFGAISTLEGEEKEDAMRLAEAYNSYRGVSERFRADMQRTKAEAEATIDSHISQEDGMIHKATLKDGREVYVVGGNVVQSEDGSVDLTASTGSVAVTDAKTGDIDMISPEDFVSLEQAIDPKEERERVLQESIAMHQGLMHDALFGGVAVGETHTVLDTEGNPIQVQVVADNGDGTVNVTTDGQMVIPMSKDDVLLHERSMRMTDYQMQRGLDMTGQSADPVFYLGDGITFTDADGNTISGTVASRSDDGVQIQTPSGVLQRPLEMLNDAITNVTDEDGNVRWDRANPVGTTSANETQNESNETQNESNETSEVKKRIPTNDKGELLYEQAEADDAWDAILEDTDNDVEMAQRVANEMVAQKEAELKAIEKKKTKSATTIPEKIAIEKARKAEIAQAKQDLEAWKNIAGTTKRREDAAKAEERRRAEEAAAQRKAEEERLKAEREEALRKEREALNGVPDMVDDTPQDARARGYRRVGGHKVERQSPVRGVAGKDVQVKFSNKAMPQGRVMVIEANELLPSHTQGQRNAQHFLDEAQPKERKDSASMLASQKIAENIRPEEITSSVTAYTGAPTTNSRGEVIQGNSRSDALKQMWDNYPEQAAKYKQYLIEHAEELGLDAEAVAQMERPVLVNMLEVADEDAITLGQFVAQDTESGGVERIKAKNVLHKMGSDVRNFANRLLQSADEDTSFAGLIDANGASVIQWMAQKGYITPTQQQSAYDGKGNLTAEAKNDLRSVMYQSIFKGGNTQLEEMFNALPVKAQKAILATAYRDYDSPVAERMIEEIQSSISAFYALSQDSAFASARNITEARAAIEAWKNQYQMDYVTGESYLPSDKFSNFALHLATMYKGENQSVIQGTFNKMFDLIQGIQEADLFNENPDTTPRTLVEAIKEVLNIDYNGQLRSNVLGDNHPTSQRGQQGSTGNVASGKQNQDGQGTDDGGGRTGISDIEPGGQRDATNTTGRQHVDSSQKELDENGHPFVVASNGTTTFGVITEETGLPTAPIKLSEGFQDEDGKGYGLLHIEANHGQQIRNAGFSSVEEFVSFVATNYDENNIRVGKRRDKSGSITYLIQVTDEHDNTLFIELSRDGSYWNVNSGGVFRKGYSNKKRTVVKTEPQQPNNAVSTDSSLSESGDNGITPTEPNGESTVPFSNSKGTDISSAEQKNAGENVSGGVNELIAQAESETDVTPTEGQKKAGNYKKGKVKVAGYEISIEQPKGSVRRGVDANGKAWEQTMHNTYGYFLGTEGVDGDHIDVFLANDMDAWNGEQVFVVDQYNEDGSFDEHKVMLGFNSIEDAQSAYLSNYEDGWADKHNIVVTGTSASDFKKWVDSSHRKTKAFAEYKTVKTTEGQSMGEPTHETETLENGDVSITNRNSRGEVTNVSVERDGKIVSVDSYQDGALFERTEYDADGNATNVTRYGKNGEVVGVQEYEGGVAKTGKRSDTVATKGTKDKKGTNEEAKIEDVGEVLAGARKDALKVIASAFENATIQSLIELPFAKAFKKPDLKKAVESGALREEDAAFYEAWFSTMINTAKPKLSRRVRESHIRSWAEDVYKSLQVLKEFVEADVATRDRVVAEMMANKFPTEAEELAKIEQRKEWNKGSNTTWGDKTTPNRLWVAHEVLKRLDYKAGDKLDIPFGILHANATGTGYDFYNSKGQRLVMNAVATVEEGIEHIVYLTKLKRGDADVKHPVSSFTFVPTKTDYVESGRYRVVYGSVHNPSIREFDSLYEAESFARNRKDAFVRPISEVSRQYAYKVKFVHPLTGEKMFADEKEFDTRSEAEQYLQEQYDAVNEHVNDELAKERGEKRALSADDVVEVVAFYGEGKIQYSVCVHRKYANNMGMPLPLRDFATRAEAVKYASEIKDDVFKAVQQSIEDRKAFTFFATGEDTRIGEDYRQGKDVTADEFMEAFGFRGVQFGNWTNQRDRQMAVNQAYDALHDLAKLLGVSPNALSLNGELGIAFGSRGSGNANAHYELDEVVINLTKTRGAGSLAHEWWHALDNYFARMAEVPRGMVTDSRNLPMREALREAFNALLSQVDKSKYLQRSKSRGDYWGRMHEVTARLLAEWVDQSLKAKGEVNTFLSRGADVEKYKQMNYKLYKRATEVAGETPMPYEEFAELDAALDGIPYPTAEEVSEFGTALRRIFDVMQERETDDGKVALFNIADEALMAERGSEAFERATERTIDALKAAGVEVVEATDAMVEEVLGAEFVEMQTIQVANERFNHELDDFSKKQHKGLLHLGRPMSVLTAAGVNARELTLSPKVLNRKLEQHGLTTENLKGLAKAIQSPILVYKHGEKAPNIVVVTELNVNGGKLSIALELDANGDVVDVNNVSSVHSKEAATELVRLGKMGKDGLQDGLRWVEKEKVQDWLSVADLDSPIHTNNPELVDVAKVLQDFENPKISPEFHRVYHGSGAKFDKFDHSFMGTGEGAQAFGWGTYVTEVEGIGRAYANVAQKNILADEIVNNSYHIHLMEQNIERGMHEIAENEAITSFENPSEKAKIKARIAQRKEYISYAQSEISKLKKRNEFLEKNLGDIIGNRVVYTIEIPNNDGANYLNWERGERNDGAVERIAEGLQKEGFELVPNANHTTLERDGKRVVLNAHASGAYLYAELSEALGSDKAASEFLNRIGYVGIKYPTESLSGGNKDGKSNYVIFNEADAQITDRVEFLRTADGVVYGWAVDGKIYLTKEGMNPNTPAHEYTHLWAHMIEKTDPVTWNRIVHSLKGCATWNDVLNDNAYEGIWNDDNRMASEVLSRLTGSENYRREMARAQQEIADAKGAWEKAEKISAWEKVKQALKAFLDKVRKLLNINGKTAKVETNATEVGTTDIPSWMEFVNWALEDLYGGINPVEVVNRRGRDAMSVETIIDEFGLNPSAFSEIINAREGLERYKSILDEDIYKYAIEDYETGASGVAFPRAGITFVFKENCYDELEEQITWWHEQTHVASYHVAFPNKSYLANKALEWLKENAPEQHNQILELYDESEWNEEGIATFIGELINRYGTSKFLKADFAELKELATLADIIRNTIQHGTEDTNRRIKGGYRFGQPTSKPIPEFERSRESESVQGGRPIGRSQEELGSVRGDATHGTDYRRYGGDATQGHEHRRNHRASTQGDREVSQGDVVTREGEGSFSDDALSSMSDPMAKMLGASTYSARQRREFAERARKRMVRRAESIAKELHLDNVEVVTDVSVLPEGKKRGAKGFYSKSTGKITIVVPNHAGTYDIQQTVLHEAVAHYGLRQLFGTHFDTFLDNVFENVSSEIRNRIIGLARQNGWDIRTATEEYLATLAEDVEFSTAQKSSWWSKIKGFFLKMLADAGVKLDFTLSDNELRYILWRSYQNLANPGKYASVVEQAADIAKQHDLKVGNYRNSATDLDAVAEQVREREDVLFREDTPRERAIIRDRYERRVKTGWYQTQEALQDSMLGLKEAMQAIVGDKTYIEDIEGFENAYLGENRLSSVNKAEIDWFVNTHFKPLYEIVKSFASTEKEQEVLEDYMFAKHGLERNRVMAEREAQKAYDAYKAEHPRGRKTLSEFVGEYRKQDYAGLTALTGKEDVAEAEAEAQRMVAIYETEHSNTDLLWMKWNQVTKAILEKTYKSGIISKQTFDKISGMYEYYVPLRGFDETTSMDEYAYLGKKDNGFNPPVKVAGGRRSKADNPFAYLESMAESSIMQGNRNELVKQKMLNFVLNHPSDLFSVSELWLEHDDVTDEWKPVFPTTLSEHDSPEEIQQKMDDFEARMEALAKATPDKYKRGRDAKDIPYRVVDKATLSEHQVIVKRNGRSVIITVNGNPRAAQALNGMTNPDNHAKGAIDKILRTGENVNRWLSANYTTRNPDFVAGNFLRDTLYTNMMVWVKESPNYATKFHKNWALCNPMKMGKLYKKYQAGTLDMSDELEAMFQQFMLNGGETGYMNMSDVETHKKEIAKKLRTKNAFKNGWDVLKDFFDYINRSVENTARFAAFVTSRQMGRSIDRSIYDAKEISVNFNKKGAGDKFLGETGQTWFGNASAGVSALGRSGFVFWNAALQGSTNFGRQVKRHPVKALSAAASMFMLGALTAHWWGDDDDDDYYNLPEYVRRSNIIFPVGGSSYVSLPLPIEFRAMYGMGELMMSVMKGKERKSGWELGMEIASQVSQVFPIDVLQGGGSWTNFVPSSVKPIVDVVRNVDWTGLPIYKDNPYNKHNPEYTEVYSSANKYLVGISEWLNNNTGGDAHTNGAININPAAVEYLLESYFGGYASTADKMIKMGETWFGEREYDPRSFLLWNRLVKSGDERTEQRYVNDTYFKLKKEADVVEHRLRGYKNDTKYGIFDYAEKISYLEQSPEYGRYEILKPYQRKIEKYQRKIKEAEKKNRTDRVDEWKEKIDSLKHLIVEEVEAYDKMRKQ